MIDARLGPSRSTPAVKAVMPIAVDTTAIAPIHSHASAWRASIRSSPVAPPKTVNEIAAPVQTSATSCSGWRRAPISWVLST